MAYVDHFQERGFSGFFCNMLIGTILFPPGKVDDSYHGTFSSTSLICIGCLLPLEGTKIHSGQAAQPPERSLSREVKEISRGVSQAMFSA